MPKTVTKRAPRKNTLAGLLNIGDNEKQLAIDTASGVNDVFGRGTLAGLLGTPADVGNMLWNGGIYLNNKIKDIEYATGLKKKGLGDLITKKPKGYLQYSENPYGGSEHIGQKMQDLGLVSATRRPYSELVASLISPSALAKSALNAPKTARNMLKALDNLEAPSTMRNLSLLTIT